MQVFAREPSYALAPDGRIHFAPGYDYVINSVDQAGRLLRSVRYRLVVAER
jgi:hypothetical protein